MPDSAREPPLHQLIEAIDNGVFSEHVCNQLLSDIAHNPGMMTDLCQYATHSTISRSSIPTLFLYLHQILLGFGRQRFRQFHSFCLSCLQMSDIDQASITRLCQDLIVSDHDFLISVIDGYCTHPSSESILQLLRHQCSLAPCRFLEHLCPFLCSKFPAQSLELLTIMCQFQILSYCDIVQCAPFSSDLVRDLGNNSSQETIANRVLAICIVLSSVHDGMILLADTLPLLNLLRLLLLWKDSPSSLPTIRSRSNSLPAGNIIAPMTTFITNLVGLAPAARTSEVPNEIRFATSKFFGKLYELWPWETICCLRKEACRSLEFLRACQPLLVDVPLLPEIVIGKSHRYQTSLLRSSSETSSLSQRARNTPARAPLWASANGDKLPEEPGALRAAAQLMQIELTFERFQRRQLEDRLKSGFNCPSDIKPSNKSSDARAIDQNSHLRETLRRGRDDLHQHKRQQRKWEAEILHKMDKLKLERSSATERCLLLERSNVSLQQNVARLESKTDSLRLQLNKARDDVLVAQHENRNNDRFAELETTITVLSAELVKAKAHYLAFQSKAASAAEDAVRLRERSLLERLSQGEELLAHRTSRINVLESQLEAINSNSKNLELTIEELKKTVEKQKEYMMVQMQAVDSRYDALKQINKALQHNLILLRNKHAFS
uniref:Uncharacterized protein n=1 Tax=Spongospora subterranea TaxID=70186 RepID=A0A0H5QJD1_9EUKA|eukprot:CRZ02220.1 hypothetical protein [Spongospora subterranea]